MDPSEEIKQLYFQATPKTIDRDLARAIDLLRAMPDEEARERLAVYMDGLSQMRNEARAGGGGGGGGGSAKPGSAKARSARGGPAKGGPPKAGPPKAGQPKVGMPGSGVSKGGAPPKAGTAGPRKKGPRD